MHCHCLAKFRRQKNSCPSCSNAWFQDKQLLPVGEDAAKEGQDGKRQTRMRSAEQSEGEDVESEGDHEPSQDITPQNNARKGRKNPVRANNNMEVDSQPQNIRRSLRR